MGEGLSLKGTVLSRMEFSKFLEILYKNKRETISNQHEFILGLFLSTGNEFNCSPDESKKLVQGTRGLSQNYKIILSRTFDDEKVSQYIYTAIDDKRIVDLFNAFGISDEEKRNISVLCDVLAKHFEGYLKNEEITKTLKVSDLYFEAMDRIRLSEDKNADEKALLFAKNYYLQALQAFSSISLKDSVLCLQRPIENIFDSFFKIFNVLNLKCTHKALMIIKEIKNNVLDGSEPEVDDYLTKIAEPGSEPITLIKEMSYVVYKYFASQDIKFNVPITINDIYEYQLIRSGFKKIDFEDNEEVFFSEYISFKEINKNINLVPLINKIRERINIILNRFQETLDQDYVELGLIDKQIDEQFIYYF